MLNHNVTHTCDVCARKVVSGITKLPQGWTRAKMIVQGELKLYPTKWSDICNACLGQNPPTFLRAIPKLLKHFFNERYKKWKAKNERRNEVQADQSSTVPKRIG